MVEIRGSSSPAHLPPSTDTAAAAQTAATQATNALKGTSAVSAPNDQVVHGEARPSGPAATLAPAAPPAVTLSEENLAGASSFAAQLHSLHLSNDSNDLTTAFLKLGVHGEKYDREFENAAQQAESILRQLAIQTARKMNTTSATSTAELASLTQALQALDRNSRDMVKDGNSKEEEKLRKALQGQMDGKEDKSVSQEKREAQLKKPGPKGAAAVGGAGAGAATGADAGLASAAGSESPTGMPSGPRAPSGDGSGARPGVLPGETPERAGEPFLLSPTADRALVRPALTAIEAGVGQPLPKEPVLALEVARQSVAQAVEAFSERAGEVAKQKLR